MFIKNPSPFLGENTQTDRQALAQKACQIQGEGSSSEETVVPIYSCDVTGHPRGQGKSRHKRHSSYSVCVCVSVSSTWPSYLAFH